MSEEQKYLSAGELLIQHLGYSKCGPAVITCCIFCGLEYDSTFWKPWKSIVLPNSSLEIGSPLLKLPCSSMLVKTCL